MKIPVKDGEIPAYRAQPEIGENFPVILVIQEIFGVHEHIQDIARRVGVFSDSTRIICTTTATKFFSTCEF